MTQVHPVFDPLLGGQLQPEVVTLVYGPPASGKTNFSLMAAAKAAEKGTVIYVDPEGGFSPERFRQIAGKKSDTLSKNILLRRPHTFEEQTKDIENLAAEVEKRNISLVIVDGIAMLYRVEEGRDIKALGRNLAHLLRIARKYQLPVLATNQVYQDPETKRNVPVGGQLLSYWCKVIVELDFIDDIRVATLRKHLHQPEGLSVAYRITQEGVEALGEMQLRSSLKPPFLSTAIRMLKRRK
ncbi:DNA repair and recombination protein RadB [uncultured archaeon]|nr:DNA repair and recombination protein RadB [uncultured archaeon]